MSITELNKTIVVVDPCETERPRDVAVTETKVEIATTPCSEPEDTSSGANVGNGQYSEYFRLKVIAKSLVNRELRSTLTATDLVHELFLKAERSNARDSISTGGLGNILFGTRMMKQILIDRARVRLTRSKSEVGAARRLLKAEINNRKWQASRFVVDLDDSINELSVAMPENAELVRLRLYDELSVEKAAEQLGISRSTAYRKWIFCQAWLAKRMRAVEHNEAITP